MRRCDLLVAQGFDGMGLCHVGADRERIDENMDRTTFLVQEFIPIMVWSVGTEMLFVLSLIEEADCSLRSTRAGTI